MTFDGCFTFESDEVIQSPNLLVTMMPARRATQGWIRARLLRNRKSSHDIGGGFGKEEGALIPSLHIGQGYPLFAIC